MNTPLHIQRFNDKIRMLNQAGSRELLLTAAEARNLHTEIFEMLAEITQLQERVIQLTENPAGVTEVELDGGLFK
jgi:hypothetical protein